MCMDLAGLREAMVAYAAGFDVALIAPGELATVVEQAGAIEKLAGDIALLAAGRMAEGAGCPGGVRPGSAERLAVEKLAAASGKPLGKARRAVETARRLAAQPELVEALRAGQLSPEQAEAVSLATEANPAAAEGLLALARTASFSELAAEAARRAAEVTDLQARRQRTYQQRALRSWCDAFGTWHLQAHGLPEDGAKVMAAVQRFADACFEQARRQGRWERPEAYGYDGLVRLASGGDGTKVGYEVMVRADLEALLRGNAIAGETCEVAGYGPVPPQAVYDLMDSGDPFLKAVVTKGKTVVGVAHLGRRPNAYQRSALDWLFPTCAVEGCGVRADFLQTDHRLDWARSHVTVFDLLDRLCRRHHAMKTNDGWALVEGRGKRAFVPPDDPRHPANAQAHRGSGPPSAA
ncbi:MAG: HNH endonuclease signature motif containing protein [Acidimicrobiales bacterium]